MKSMTRILLIISILGIFPVLYAHPETKQQYDARMEWWREARFGMFIHWGLYSIPAGEWNGKTGYGEWIRHSAQIPVNVYDQFLNQFNPQKFNATQWVKLAKDAGMKYIVITTKHHDGYCNFDTKQTDFSVMSTPFKRDPMKELADACRKENMKLCFYYSIMDWHHPDYLPRRDWETARSDAGADFDRYIIYMKAELKELLTNYGDIGVLWFDGEWERTWNEKYGKEIYDYCRSLQPGIIINNRVGAGRMDMEGMTKEGAFGGDFGTPEQQIPATGLPGIDWETCMTMNDHWGFNKNDHAFKSSKELIRMLADIASKGGNYLLNVGPTSEGLFPRESIVRLREIGKWMKVNKESVYNTKASPFKLLEWGRCTRKDIPGGVRLYLHVFDWPSSGQIILPGCLNTPVKAWLLADVNNTAMTITRKEDGLVIQLPVNPADAVNSVVVLDLKGRLDLTDAPEIKADFDKFVNNVKVDLNSSRDNVRIYYTIDGSTPTVNSLLYNQPLTLTNTTVITARCFRDGKPVSANSIKEFKKVPPLGSVMPEEREPGISYAYYEGNWDSLPDFRNLKPVKKGVLKQFDFSTRQKDEYFAMEYTGYLLITDDDIYSFSDDSDDGSALYIDDIPIVNNDGLHGMLEKEGEIALSEGFHPIRVTYFNKAGDFGLKISIRSPQYKKQLIRNDWLYHKP
ncbi:MAG: alpha-L-fucosidase [Bacteroidetes bacterium]|nr:alpha-L-fucosidase [Bacteroidota bacterium]